MKAVAIVEIAAAVAAGASAASVFDDGRLTSYCVMGGMAGAFLGVYLFRDKPTPSGIQDSAVRRYSLKFGTSLMVAIVFTPGFYEILGWPMTVGRICTFAAVLGLFGIKIINSLTPKVESIGDLIVDLIRGRRDKSEEPEPKKPHVDGNK